MYIVIGASGQDGSFVCDRLEGEGKKVIGITRAGWSRLIGFTAEETKWLMKLDKKRVNIERCPLLAIRALEDIDSSFRIIDCSADHSSMMKRGTKGEGSIYSSNMERSRVIFEVLRYLVSSRHVTNASLVTCGSSLMYDGIRQEIVDEETNEVPLTEYGRAKLEIRRKGIALREHGYSVSMAILFNHDSSRRKKNYFIPRAIESVAEISRGLRVEKMGCLNKSIDLGCAMEYSDALVLLSDHMDECPGGDFVVASGQSVTLREIVDMIGEEFGVERASNYLHEEGPEEDKKLIGDPRKISEEIGWRARIRVKDLVQSIVRQSGYWSRD